VHYLLLAILLLLPLKGIIKGLCFFQRSITYKE
jgi:hypothetical protein